MTDTRSAANDLADAFGADLTYLQPPDEQRFDPATVAVMVGLWVLRAVAEGVRDGIKEAAADRTKAVVPAVMDKVKGLLPRWIARGFARKDADGPTDQDHAETATVLMAARDAAAGLDPALGHQLPDAVATAVREVLAAQGLPGRTAARVEQVLRVQVEIVLSQG